jgi:hypothetical protein
MTFKSGMHLEWRVQHASGIGNEHGPVCDTDQYHHKAAQPDSLPLVLLPLCQRPPIAPDLAVQRASLWPARAKVAGLPANLGLAPAATADGCVAGVFQPLEDRALRHDAADTNDVAEGAPSGGSCDHGVPLPRLLSAPRRGVQNASLAAS